jgi:alkylhydroperoxidase family enzyme
MNSGILLQYGVLPDMLADIKLDPSKAPLEEKETALLLFVLKVVRDSNSVQEADVNALRDLGWTDSDILEATYHGTTQVSSDRIFNAFKIDPEM